MTPVCAPIAPSVPWGSTPTPSKAPAWPHLKVDPGLTVRCTIYCERCERCQVHPYEGYTLGCTGDNGDCWCDHRHCASIVQGMLLVRTAGSCTPHLVLLTNNALWTCPKLYEPGLDLRGWRVAISREPGGQTAKMHCRIEAPECLVGESLRAPDLRRMMYRIWAGGAKRIRMKGKGSPRLQVAEEFWLREGYQV